MSQTRQQIIDLADQLIREKGYNAFSYKDISSVLNIKNAAVHYHFPSKAELGKAVIQQNWKDYTRELKKWDVLNPTQSLEAFIQVYEKLGSQGLVCFMGAMGAAYETLPEIMQSELTAASAEIRLWLRQVLRKGLETNEFHFTEKVEEKADFIISALLSSLILQRVTKENIPANVKSAILASVK